MSIFCSGRKWLKGLTSEWHLSECRRRILNLMTQSGREDLPTGHAVSGEGWESFGRVVIQTYNTGFTSTSACRNDYEGLWQEIKISSNGGSLKNSYSRINDNSVRPERKKLRTHLGEFPGWRLHINGPCRAPIQRIKGSIAGGLSSMRKSSEAGRAFTEVSDRFQTVRKPWREAFCWYWPRFNDIEKRNYIIQTPFSWYNVPLSQRHGHIIYLRRISSACNIFCQSRLMMQKCTCAIISFKLRFHDIINI